MSITVVGSVAFDAVKTPFGERERMLGGAATYFALAASFFDQVHVVGRVGEDFGDEDLAVVALRDTDVGNIERVPGGKSFFCRSTGVHRGARVLMDLAVFIHKPCGHLCAAHIHADGPTACFLLIHC